MKVLEKGPIKPFSLKLKCTGAGNARSNNEPCGSLLLVESDDIYETESSALSETCYYFTFRCSVCGNETDIDRAAIPRFAQIQAGKNKKPHMKEFDD